MIFNDQWGGGVSHKVIFNDQGGGGVQAPPKKQDIINEQPFIGVLLGIFLYINIYFFWYLEIFWGILGVFCGILGTIFRVFFPSIFGFF